MPSPLFAKKPLSMIHEEMKGENRLRRVLGPVQLTLFGIGATIADTQDAPTTHLAFVSRYG